MTTIAVSIAPKLLELETSNLIRGFLLIMLMGCTNNFPVSGRDLGHVTLQFLAYNRAYRLWAVVGLYMYAMLAMQG